MCYFTVCIVLLAIVIVWWYSHLHTWEIETCIRLKYLHVKQNYSLPHWRSVSFNVWMRDWWITRCWENIIRNEFLILTHISYNHYLVILSFSIYVFYLCFVHTVLALKFILFKHYFINFELVLNNTKIIDINIYLENKVYLNYLNLFFISSNNKQKSGMVAGLKY